MRQFTFADTLPITVEAGEEVSIPVNCSFVYVAELVGGSVVMTTEQGRVPLILGRRVEFNKLETRGIRLKNSGDSAAVMVLIIGSGDVRDSNVVGTVSVVDGTVARVLQNKAFWAHLVTPKVAAQYSLVEIENKSITENMIINHLRIEHSAVASSAISIDHFSAALVSAGGVTLKNKKVGGADIPGQDFDYSNLGSIPARTELAHRNILAGDGWSVDIGDALILIPGERIGVTCHYAGESMSVNIAGYMVAV